MLTGVWIGWGLVMADEGPFREDISGLWGAPREGALEPPRPSGTVTNGRAHEPAPTNGAHADVATHDPGDNVARLADAIAGRQVDVVRHSELGTVRAELEDAFTQKLAVVLYELLSTSNERFSSVEDHMDRRLQAVAAELGQAIRAHSDQLAAAIDVNQRATVDLARSVRDELIEISDRFSAPVDTLAAFQREVRHQVGRVGDAVDANGAEAARRADAEAERAAQASAALSERLDGSETRATQSLEKISERMSSVQTDLIEVREAITGLQEEIKSLRGRSGTRRRWGRSG
jgi:chromosome segregation ATPase